VRFGHDFPLTLLGCNFVFNTVLALTNSINLVDHASKRLMPGQWQLLPRAALILSQYGFYIRFGGRLETRYELVVYLMECLSPVYLLKVPNLTITQSIPLRGWRLKLFLTELIAHTHYFVVISSRSISRAHLLDDLPAGLERFRKVALLEDGWRPPPHRTVILVAY